MSRYYPPVKRFFDLFFSLLLIFLLSPLLFLLTLANICFLGFPIFFAQKRVGLSGRIFNIYKFRSMRSERSAFHTDSSRLTSYGRFIRSTSLDELPSLFNIVKGHMSFVGPRPLLVDYLPLYSSFQLRRHSVLPGLSGWAQINGRNSISWEEKFRLDVWYVDHQSFWLDLIIFLRTIFKVIRQEGISAAGEATMAPFTGSSEIE